MSSIRKMMNPAIAIKDVYKSFGLTKVISGLDLKIDHGKIVGLIGPNGAGKTTLFNLISGLLSPTSGHILINGKSIVGKKSFEIQRLGLSRSFQMTNIFSELSVFENFRCAVLWRLGYRYGFWTFLSNLKEVNAEVYKYMSMVELDLKATMSAGKLSYAEQRLLELGITFASEASIILLDEPTSGLSQVEVIKFINLLRMNTTGKTVLIVEHDMNVIFDVVDEIVVMSEGKVIAFDVPSKVSSNPCVQDAYLGVSLKIGS